MGGKATPTQRVPKASSQRREGRGWQRRGVLSGVVALAQPWLNLVKIKSKDIKLESGGNTSVWYLIG